MRHWQPEGGIAPESALRRLTRDPLIHFLLLGAILFAIAHLWDRAHDPHRIVIDRAQLERIAAGYRERFGAPPSSAQLQAAIADHVADEALLREGIRRGIDRDDEIVRRRIIQKMRFLEESRAVPNVRPLADADLHAWFAAHRALYARLPRVTFRHLYFVDGPGEPAEARAARARAALARGANPAVLGDPFPERDVYAEVDAEDIDRMFGGPGFARSVLALPPGGWSEPLRSGLGVHLVQVETRFPAAPADFDVVRDRVVADAARARRNEAEGAALARLIAGYTVVLP